MFSRLVKKRHQPRILTEYAAEAQSWASQANLARHTGSGHQLRDRGAQVSGRGRDGDEGRGFFFRGAADLADKHKAEKVQQTAAGARDERRRRNLVAWRASDAKLTLRSSRSVAR
jgi:hypothetical protein